MCTQHAMLAHSSVEFERQMIGVQTLRTVGNQNSQRIGTHQFMQNL